MKNHLNHKTPEAQNVDVGNKLTDEQLVEIKRYMVKRFAKQIAETYAGITTRQVVEVFNQRSNNAERNKIVWDAIGKKLLQNDRQDLFEAVQRRLSFCTSLLVI